MDVAALCNRLLPGESVSQVRYFSARIKARPGSDPQSPARQQAYLRALETSAQVSVHLGHFLVTYPRMAVHLPKPGAPRTVEVIKTEEKGSDVNLATYMIFDACRGDCDAIAIVTNDSDFAEPLRLVHDKLGLWTTVINPQPPAKRSRKLVADAYKQLRRPLLSASQFPDELVDRAGRKIHKPTNW